MFNKPDWLFRQSAAIPYLLDDEQWKIVLITSNSSGSWIFPKGVVERDLSPWESAAKEAEEEAGVIGLVSEEIITQYDYEKWGGICHVQVYSLFVTKVLSEWDEMQSRERTIVSVDEALTIVKPSLKEIIEAFMTHVSGGDSRHSSLD